MNKWQIIILVFTLGLIFLYFAGRKTFHAEIVIPAPVEKVWAVLNDVEQYEQWHPLLSYKSGDLEAGGTINYTMTQPNGKQSEFATKVRVVEARKHLKQYAGLPLVLTAEHEYILESVGNQTKVIQHEVDNGVAMLFWDSSWVQPMYERVNEALKKRVMELEGDEKNSSN